MEFSISVASGGPGCSVRTVLTGVRAKAPACRTRALAAAVYVVLVFVPACSTSSPTAAGSPNQNHVFASVTDGVRRPLAGASVRVLDGPMAGTTRTSNTAGRFELYRYGDRHRYPSSCARRFQATHAPNAMAASDSGRYRCDQTGVAGAVSDPARPRCVCRNHFNGPRRGARFWATATMRRLPRRADVSQL